MKIFFLFINDEGKNTHHYISPSQTRKVRKARGNPSNRYSYHAGTAAHHIKQPQGRRKSRNQETTNTARAICVGVDKNPAHDRIA